MIHEHKGAIFIPISEPVKGEVCDDVCDIALIVFFLSQFRHGRIMVIALSGQNIPIIESSWVVNAAVAEVPFSDEGGLISRLLQKLGKSQLSPIHFCSKGGHPVDVVVGSCEDGCTTGTANRIRAKTVVKSYAFVGDAVEIGRLVDAAAIAA